MNLVPVRLVSRLLDAPSMKVKAAEAIAIAGGVRPHRALHLIVMSGDQAGLVYRVEDGMTIGRGDGADVSFRARTVSRRHASIRGRGARFLIEDGGSRNGVFVGLERIGTPREIVDGDDITIGDISVVKAAYLPSVGGSVATVEPAIVSNQEAVGRLRRPRIVDQLRAEHAFCCRNNLPLVIAFVKACAIPETDALTDGALAAVEAIVRDGMGAEDLIARVNDSEWVLVVRAHADRAVRLAERVRKQIVRSRAVEMPVTIAAGLVPIPSDTLLAAETLLIAAHNMTRTFMSASERRVAQLAPLRVLVSDVS